jgi:hypothetical protein
MPHRNLETTQEPTCLMCAAVAALQYAHGIALGDGLQVGGLDPVEATAQMRRVLVEERHFGWSVADAQAVMVEDALRAIATSLADIVRLRHAAKLIDLGARPVLSERALHELQRLEVDLHNVPSSRAERIISGARPLIEAR